MDKCHFIEGCQKKGFVNRNKENIQTINFTKIYDLIKKYNFNPELIKEKDIIEKKLINKNKGKLKLLNKGDVNKPFNIEISYASKEAIKSLEKIGGKITITSK